MFFTFFKYKETSESEKVAGDKPKVDVTDLTRYIPLQRLGNRRDVSDSVLFLASELSSYMTGQALLVDGGVFAILPNWMPMDPDFMKHWTAKF